MYQSDFFQGLVAAHSRLVQCYCRASLWILRGRATRNPFSQWCSFVHCTPIVCMRLVHISNFTSHSTGYKPLKTGSIRNESTRMRWLLMQKGPQAEWWFCDLIGAWFCSTMIRRIALVTLGSLVTFLWHHSKMKGTTIFLKLGVPTRWHWDTAKSSSSPAIHLGTRQTWHDKSQVLQW